MTCQKPIKTGFARLTKPARLGKLFLALLLVIGLLGGHLSASAHAFRVEVVKVKTAKGEFFFKTELAMTAQERRQGLMFRQSMGRDEAMLFRWPDRQPVIMWMKNTKISLDMVFIRKDGHIANIARSTTPDSLAPVASKGEVVAVLELVAGTAEQIGLAEGDVVLHRMFR